MGSHMTDLDAHPEWQSLLAFIIAHPDDDLARLVGADWLEEHESQDVRCRGCPDRPGRDHRPYPGGWDECERCEGSGYVSNGLALRAEFIRLQVELASLAIVPLKLAARESTLLVNNYAAWVPDSIPNRGEVVTFRRGFVDEARCPMDWWLAPERGPRIARANPIRKVAVTDRRPMAMQTGYFSWLLSQNSRPVGDEVPQPIFDCLTGGGSNKYAKYYQTEKDALDDLSQALIAWARSTK